MLLLFVLFSFVCLQTFCISLDCENGAYRVKEPPFNDCSGFRNCEEGYYCLDGIKYVCPAGYFGNQTLLNDSTCSGPCPPGFYCPLGTIRGETNPCGNSSLYCPLGSSIPIVVPRGYFSVDKQGIEFSDSKTKSAILPCPYGSYCINGIKLLCPSGRFGNQMQLSSQNCSGVCPAGFFCPEGSISPFEFPCDANPTIYCPEASPRPLTTGLGYYSISNNISDQYNGGYIDQKLCPRGSYCLEGIRYDCPAGRYGILPQETNSSCTGICKAGFYCPPGSIMKTQIQCTDPSTFCPEGSSVPTKVFKGFYSITGQITSNLTLSQNNETFLDGTILLDISLANQTSCEPGFYCIEGIRWPCPRGRFGATYSLSTAECSGYCEEGYYCPEQSISSKQYECGAAYYYCPLGSYEPKYVNTGYYTIEGYNEATRFTERLCEPGFYCINGTKHLCLQGYFGSTFGLTIPTCSGLCSAGYYCPEGSISDREIKCGDPSRFCPAGSFHPINVTMGYYTIGGIESTRSDQKIAPKGYYSQYGLLYACPAGYFGSDEGLANPLCSGLCNIPGFYCPTASIHPQMRICGGDNFYCPSGTVAPIVVNSGFYTVDYDYEICPPGQWRNLTLPMVDFIDLGGYSAVTTITIPKPLCRLCPDGYYKSLPGDDISFCLPCNITDSISSADRKTCLCTTVYQDQYTGYFNITTGKCHKERKLEIELYFDDREWSQNTSVTRFRQYPCEAGYFCSYGLRYKCPAGYFGSIDQETNPLCSGICKEGFFCPETSTTPYSKPCGAANLICPQGSPVPILVPPGYYTHEDVPEDLRYIQIICPVGYFCPGDGKRYKCSPGTYTTQEGTISDQCMGICYPGYYCEAGSPSPVQFECGNSSVYCPRGSSKPSYAHKGFYTTHSGGDAGEQNLWENANKTCSVELPCEPGYYCQSGVKYPCPPGTFGWRYGMTERICGGQCPPGYYCPSYLDPQPNAPSFTQWPGKPHVKATDYQCGDVNYYCPRGSYYPTPVLGGYYSIGGNSDNKTRSDQVICPPGSYCINSIRILCPPGRYGSTSGLSSSDCTAGCPPAYYCPSGTSEPIACPFNYFSTGLVSACSPCPSERTTPMKCQNENSCCLRA